MLKDLFSLFSRIILVVYYFAAGCAAFMTFTINLLKANFLNVPADEIKLFCTTKDEQLVPFSFRNASSFCLLRVKISYFRS